MAWRATWRDESAVAGSSYRRYTLGCTKYNHGPRPAPLAFAAGWQFGIGGDPGILTFYESEPVVSHRPDEPARLSRVDEETLESYRKGYTTPAPLAADLGIDANTAKARLRRLRERGLLPASESVE